MKKVIIFSLYVIMILIIFTGCNPLFPLDKDNFDIGDTVQVHVGRRCMNPRTFGSVSIVLKTEDVQLVCTVGGQEKQEFG